MKKNIFICLSSFALFFYCIPSNAQPTHEQQNLQKYWIYRERMKNYMITASASGCNVPSKSRSVVSDQLSFSDSFWQISYWIGTLAMEYDLLSKAGYNPLSPELMRTKQDLFNAIEAVNRIDCQADATWACTGVDCPTNSLNGFSLADDVPGDFHQRLYSGETGSDLLNEGLVPPPDGYRIKCINSAFAGYLSAREVSVDHVAGLFIGLALVKKFIPATLNSDIHFTDFYPEFNYVKEVQNIANRYITWMQSAFPHQWKLRNLCVINRLIIV
ncbi:MAG: hypothetical protein EPN85_06940 [Bacteroidetes bacterium]|nr:MAG: hypothetical protein EPN85_06940 [Bacteroidota bacterium]